MATMDHSAMRNSYWFQITMSLLLWPTRSKPRSSLASATHLVHACVMALATALEASSAPKSVPSAASVSRNIELGALAMATNQTLLVQAQLIIACVRQSLTQRDLPPRLPTAVRLKPLATEIEVSN